MATRLVLRTVALLPAGCFGVLLWDGVPFAVSLERTFDDLAVVIPAGVHRCTHTHFERGGYDTFEVDVPGHARVLLHKGNVETESKGCILLGRCFGVLNGAPAILDSRTAFADFMTLAKDLTEFDLEVFRL
jgi:hypothetical protein